MTWRHVEPSFSGRRPVGRTSADPLMAPLCVNRQVTASQCCAGPQPSSSRLRLTTAAGRRSSRASGTARRMVRKVRCGWRRAAPAGPGSDFSEAPASGLEPAALESVAAPAYELSRPVSPASAGGENR